MLRHSNDSEPGYTRKKIGRTAGPLSTATSASPTATRSTASTPLALPPAYVDAWFCKDATATSGDRQGRPRRKQYRYHADYRAKQDATKYDGCREFGEALPKIRKRVEPTSSSRKLDRDSVIAAVVRLLDTEHMRIGNEQYARANKSFGLSTLRSRHVARTRGKMKMRYVGKHGIVHEATITDASLKRVVGKCQDLPGQMLFQYVNGDGVPQPITSADVNDYIRDATGGDFTAKHFRTWGASVIFFDQLLDKGRGRAEDAQDRARAGRRSARQHPGDQPQELCPPVPDRGAAGGSPRPAERHQAPARPPPPVERGDRLPHLPQEESRARAPDASPRLEPCRPRPPPSTRTMKSRNRHRPARDRLFSTG